MKDKNKASKEVKTSEENQETEATTSAKTEENIPSEIKLTSQEFEQLKKHIETLQKERDDTVRLAQRLQADFDNFRKRNASIHSESKEEGVRYVIGELLPVLDGFDRAFENSDTIDAAWADGIKLLHKQFLEMLYKCGLSEIPSDSVFDPACHEAVMQVESDIKESGQIVDVYRKGYKVKDRIIRHSMVTVAK
ncbi:MAG: nucleotide exchange factor GrpE [Clostridia bacterium]|nr:nucleotide exchange factor GrpE [Clostridia bacterium]